MKLSRTNTVLAGLLVFVIILCVWTRVDYSRPNIEILPDMKYTPAWVSYESNPVFANGRTLQLPVPDTIARGHVPLHFAATKEDAVRAGKELENPYQASDTAPTQLPASIQRGADAYHVFCTCCHGATGAGDGLVTKRGFPPPPSLVTGNSAQMQDGQLFHILTYGQESMSEFAGQLSADTRWDLINYIRSIQAQSEPSLSGEG